VSIIFTYDKNFVTYLCHSNNSI